MQGLIYKNLCLLVPSHLTLFTPTMILESHKVLSYRWEPEVQRSMVLPKVMQRGTHACLSPKLWSFCIIFG